MGYHLFYISSPLFVFIFCFILGLLVLLRNHRSSVHRLFSLFLFSMGLWGFIVFGMRTAPDMAHALLWEKALQSISPLGAVAFWSFCVVYTRARLRRSLYFVAFTFLLFIIALSPTRLLVKSMGTDPYGYFPIFGPLLPVAALCPSLFLLLGLVRLFRAYKASSLYEERNRYLYIILGIALSLLGLVVDAVSSFGVSIPPGGIVGNIFFCFLSAWAMLKYHLLDIQVVFRRGVAYALMSVALAIPYAGIILLFTKVFEARTIPVWVYFLLLIILALALQPLWSRMQRWVDKLFYRERYDYLRTLEQFSLECQSLASPEQLNVAFIHLVSQAMQTSGCYLLLSSPLTSDFTIKASSNMSNPAPQLSLSRYSPFIQYLRRTNGFIHRQDLDVLPQLRALTAQEGGSLKEIKGELYVPLKSRGELTGVLILGPKLSQQPYSGEEERLLATIASQMATSLENAYLYAAERAQRARLETLQEQRHEFLMAVSHELKTPLTAIKLASEMLAEETKFSPRSSQGKMLKNLRLSTNSMEERVKDLLDFLKLQATSLEFEPNLEDVKAVLKDIMGSISPLISAKKQTLTAEIPDSLPPAMLDRQRFEQILFNLLSNASKYTPTGSKIKLRAELIDTELLIEVSDNGPGIPLDEQNSIFQPYYRVTNRPDYSLGLGLSIAKSLVELRGGKIWLDSQPGKGSTFSFTIPVT